MDAGTRRETPDIPPPPSNTEAEQALLGAILVNPIAYSRVSDFLTPEHFFDPVHGRIFRAIGTLIERGDPANPVTLRNLFDQDGALQDIGGGAYLARLAESAVSVLNSEHYGRAILDMHQRRALIAIGSDIVARGYTTDLDDPAERQIESAETALAGLNQGRPSGGDAMASAGDAAMRSIRGSEAAYRGDATGGIMSGIGALDSLTGGWQPGDLIYIGKRPSMGGTALAITLALNAARAGKLVGFWSAEMNAERIGRRILAWMTGIPTRAQRAGELSQSEWSALIAAQRELAAYPLLIDDASPLGVATLRRRARQMARKGLDLIIADYLQLIRSGDGRDDMPLRDAVPKVSAALRDIAKELHVPVICLAQLTPDIDGRDNKRPTISDIRWSHDAEQDAAVVAMLYRDEYYLQRAEPRASANADQMKADKLHAEWGLALEHSRGRAEIIIVKNRDDPTGTAHIAFDGARSLFTDIEENQGRFL